MADRFNESEPEETQPMELSMDEAFGEFTARYMCGCQVEYPDMDELAVLCDKHNLPMTHVLMKVKPELLERICERLKSKGNQEGSGDLGGRQVRA